MNYYRTVADSFGQTIECIAASVDLLADPMHLAGRLGGDGAVMMLETMALPG